jgi:hypothetical protein
MITERKIRLKYAGEWHIVKVSLIGKCYNVLNFNLEHGGSEVVGRYDMLSNKSELPGITSGIYPMALLRYLHKEGIEASL